MTHAVVGYCTNVHGGATLSEVRASLERHAIAVRSFVNPPGLMPIGLWLGARAAQELIDEQDGVARLRDWLFASGLAVASMNGFPYGNFHAQAVKRSVYEPHWADVRRALYTMNLADILAQLLPDATVAPEFACEGSISTLPLGWRATFTAQCEGASMGLAAAQLEQVARHLKRIEETHGACIHLDLEPEPGCMFDRAQHVVDFFDRCVQPSKGMDDPRRYLRVCHDICHSAVVFEPQRDALDCYRRGGVRVGKVQVSSAISCDGSEKSLRALRHYDEPRFLHQTCVLDGSGIVHQFDDLEEALDTAPDGVWRVHFHVPVDRETLGVPEAQVGTTQQEISQFLGCVEAGDCIRHYEVETYAWNVLPMEHRRDSLARGIADEINWTRSLMTSLGVP